MPRVLLAVMPFATVARPALGVSLLKARLAAEGIACDVRYLNVGMARSMGLAGYRRVCDSGGTLLFGEWVFAGECFGERTGSGEAHFRQVYRQITGDPRADAGAVRRLARPFLDRCLEQPFWGDYDIVGFTTAFEQNLASLALADRVKRRWPEKVVVLGGPNCEGPMGVVLHRRFPCVDYVCSGEADDSFPALVRALREGGPVDDIPGLVLRRGGRSVAARPGAPVDDLDRLPGPDFSDYFRDLSALPSGTCEELLLESSRGCWWGEVGRCTFCGLNGDTVRYRRKSGERVRAQLAELVRDYARPHRIGQVLLSDNVLDMRHFEGLLPALARDRLPVQLTCEVKSNLRREHVRALRDAGVTRVGPGVESLSTPVLKLMSKGVTGLQNVAFLKWCRQLGVFPGWSLLHGFPGETDEHVDALLALVARVVHLQPPWVASRFQLERFSRYFTDPGRFGIENVRPAAAYAHVYPFEDAALAELATYFEFDYAPRVRPPERDEELRQAVAWWRARHEVEYLYLERLSGGAVALHDGRSVARVPTLRLAGAQADAYQACERPRPLPSIVADVRARNPDLPVGRRDVAEFLDGLVELGLALREDDRYLALAVPLREERSRSAPGLNARGEGGGESSPPPRAP